MVLATTYLKRLESVPDCVDVSSRPLQRQAPRSASYCLTGSFSQLRRYASCRKTAQEFLCRAGTCLTWCGPAEFCTRKERIAQNVIENNTGAATYIMMITERSSKGSVPPEEKYVEFATSHHSVRTYAYAKRCGIETEYFKIEECRAKMRISDVNLECCACTTP